MVDIRQIDVEHFDEVGNEVREVLVTKKRHVVSCSYGKDSTAMLIGMLDRGMQVDDVVFADPLFEFDELYQYKEKVESYTGIKATVLKPDIELYFNWLNGEITRGKSKGKIRGLPLTYYPCWWSREAKFKPLDKFCKGHYRYIGVAYDEQRRIHEKEGYIYPLNDWKWTEQFCLDYLRDRGLHNPLYDIFDRLGCWWCPKQSEKSLRALKRSYPDLFEKTLEMILNDRIDTPFAEKVIKAIKEEE